MVFNMKKEFIGDCVGNPFSSVEELSDIIDNAKEITKQTFLKLCDVHEDIKQQMRKFPHDYTFFKNKEIYFFQWSMIEHFFK